MINYNNKTFAPVQNSHNGETSSQTRFHYKQTGNILTAYYEGGKISAGHLIGLVGEEGEIDMRYHQVNTEGQIMTGICQSKPEILENGKIRLHEQWQWTSGDLSQGQSIIEEL
ncbi:n-acetylglutamate synthase [Sphingobacterium sp. LRF_L2]|uniref:n-acetylglutamate synthase n=1 Tax=Sphingobacterium sp. LRF_L2 TaxID=3369421 RepID=UPI003F5EFDE9